MKDSRTTRSEPPSSTVAAPPLPWRLVAARIVEELFPATDPESWDLLLDLREHLLANGRWEETLDCFLACRERLEADHYLPFFRLRKLLAGSLRLEVRIQEKEPLVQCLAKQFRTRHRSVADLRRALGRECFENYLELPSPDGVRLAVLERV